MKVRDLNRLGALQAATAIQNGGISSLELIQACLKQIEKRENTVKAWVEFDPEVAINQAKAADKELSNGRLFGPLHGVPVGLKDIIDTFDFPTQLGSDLFKGRRPAQDATCTSLLRRAGAIILGKTVTTEFALTGVRATTNPHNEKHTPGGSSSGSAAAVADFMVPVALGSQTGGSMIRPASYCGVYGYKPSFGLISRKGVFILARVLDHLGVYGRSLEDLAFVADQIIKFDSFDFDMMNISIPKFLKNGAFEGADIPPKIGFVRGPAWPFAEPYMEKLFQDYINSLGHHATEIELSGIFDEALEVHKVVMQANLWFNLFDYRNHNEKSLLPETVRRIDDGKSISSRTYIGAIELVGSLNRALDVLLRHYDVLITPSATGEAPQGLGSTGDAVFQRLWTLTGLPTISLPHLTGPKTLPIGVQLIGRKGKDKELFGAAKWIDHFMEKNGD